MTWLRRRETSRAEHEDVNRRLDRQDEEIVKMARRVRRLEIEAGIYKPRDQEDQTT